MKKKLTIITVCYNAENFIKRTFESVINQNFYNYEYVVVDGLSNDDTIKIVKDFSDEFFNKGISFKWISESDTGIYDAMNKGIKMANGKWILFLNAGDTLFNNNVLRNFMDKKYSKNIGLVYGDTNLIYSKNKNKIRRNKNINRFKLLFYTINHQSIFFNYEIFKKLGLYNTKYKIIADKDLILKAYFNEEIKFDYINEIVANYDVNGLSSDYSELLKEKYLITKQHFSVLEYYTLFIFENLRKIKLRMIGK